MTDTDRELLERAAKAEGHAYPWFVPDRGGDRPWNPLEDDGDALRLAVTLGMSVIVNREAGKTTVEINWSPAFDGLRWFTEYHAGTDPNAATRRAIVRAAAAMGGGNG